MLYTVPLILLSLGILHSLNFIDESVVVREQLNAAALTIFGHSPIFGVGPGNFLVELPKALPSRAVYFLQPVHNIYLLVMAEGGLVGIGIFGWLIWIVIKSKTSQEQNKSRAKQVSVPTILLVPLLTLLLLGFVDHYPLTIQQGQLLFTLLLSLNLLSYKVQ